MVGLIKEEATNKKEQNNMTKKCILAFILGCIFLFPLYPMIFKAIGACTKVKCKYYCKARNLTFSVEENKNENILILGEGDSIFFKRLYGLFAGVEFFVNDSSNIIYINQDFEYNRISKNKFEYRKTRKVSEFEAHEIMYPEVEKHYYAFYPGCDQGSGTFSVTYNSSYIETLEPSETQTSFQLPF
jgi:hypothetical protein|nr:hypothetical protein [uncultured Prevotella sp.]